MRSYARSVKLLVHRGDLEVPSDQATPAIVFVGTLFSQDGNRERLGPGARSLTQFPESPARLAPGSEGWRGQTANGVAIA